MAGQDGVAGVTERPEAFGGAGLRGVVVAEGREAMVVEPACEVDDVGTQDEVADLDGLVPRRMSGSEQEADGSVPEEIVVTVY